MDISGEILEAAVERLKSAGVSMATTKIDGNFFSAVDAALDNGNVYRILVVKCNKEQNLVV
ncbi:MAG: hypothetical protein LBQ27_03685 [Clostridiales bacterium]|jgi:hypothetical protein|nr:hypothetical protein [Clostridiales bacterium]